MYLAIFLLQLYSNICSPGTSWNVTEACLFLMYAVAPSIEWYGYCQIIILLPYYYVHKSDESEVLPIAIPVLLSVPPDCHYAIRATTLRLVGELAKWIDQHPDTLDIVLKFILDGLQIPAVATYAAKAVQNVCFKCKERMAPHITDLLQIIQAADNLGISNDAILGLLKAVTEILTKAPTSEMTSGVRNLCNLHIPYLQEVMVSLPLK